MQGIPTPRAVSIDHTKECMTTWLSKPFEELDMVQQDYILTCPNEQHNWIRIYMGYEPELNLLTRQLVRINSNELH